MGSKRIEIVLSIEEIEAAHRDAEVRLAEEYGLDGDSDFACEPAEGGGVRFTQEKEPLHPVWGKIK